LDLKARRPPPPTADQYCSLVREARAPTALRKVYKPAAQYRAASARGRPNPSPCLYRRCCYTGCPMQARVICSFLGDPEVLGSTPPFRSLLPLPGQELVKVEAGAQLTSPISWRNKGGDTPGPETAAQWWGQDVQFCGSPASDGQRAHGHTPSGESICRTCVSSSAQFTVGRCPEIRLCGRRRGISGHLFHCLLLA
jgi:hypothetical protein